MTGFLSLLSKESMISTALMSVQLINMQKRKEEEHRNLYIESQQKRMSFPANKRRRKGKSIKAWLSMLRPGFEPGSPARKAGMIDRSTLSELGREQILPL
jgi:hypothetical protein